LEYSCERHIEGNIFTSLNFEEDCPFCFGDGFALDEQNSSQPSFKPMILLISGLNIKYPALYR